RLVLDRRSDEVALDVVGDLAGREDVVAADDDRRVRRLRPGDALRLDRIARHCYPLPSSSFLSVWKSFFDSRSTAFMTRPSASLKNPPGSPSPATWIFVRPSTGSNVWSTRNGTG